MRERARRARVVEQLTIVVAQPLCVTTADTEDGEYDYTYDKVDRLTSATPPASLQSGSSIAALPSEQYTYDAVSNRLSSAHQPGAWAYNADNQLTAFGAGAAEVSYDYDANGHTAQQKLGDRNAPSSVRSFRFSAAERLAPDEGLVAEYSITTRLDVGRKGRTGPRSATSE